MIITRECAVRHGSLSHKPGSDSGVYQGAAGNPPTHSGPFVRTLADWNYRPGGVNGGRISREFHTENLARSGPLEYDEPRWVSLSRLAFGRPTANLPDKACPANATVSPMTIHRFAELFAGVVVLIWCGQFLLDFLHNRQSK